MKWFLLALLCSSTQVLATLNENDPYKVHLHYTVDTYLLKKTQKADRLENIGLFIFGGEYQTEKFDFHGSLMLNHSTGSPTDSYLSDQQIASNIDTQGGEGLKPYEFYFNYHVDDSFFLRAGLIDLAKFLNITKSSLTFVNSSFATSADFGDSGILGPAIYPIPSWGLSAQKKMGKLYTFFSLTDPIAQEKLDPSNMVSKPQIDSNHYNASLEFGYALDAFEKVALGLWKLNDRRSNQSFSTQGAYFLVDKTLGRHNSFLRISRSSKVSYKMYQNIALGFVYRSLFKSNDSLHLGFSKASIEGRKYSEDVFEALFNKKFKDLTAALSYQRIRNLGGGSDYGSVLTLRLIINING